MKCPRCGSELVARRQSETVTVYVCPDADECAVTHEHGGLLT